MPKFTKADLARQYRDKHGMEMPTLKLARIMHKENQLVFKDLEQARQALRSIEGKNGKCAIKVTHKTPDRPKNPYKLPDSWGKPKEVFKLPIMCNKVGFLGDTQIPFHDNKAIIAAVEYLKHIVKSALSKAEDKGEEFETSYGEVLSTIRTPIEEPTNSLDELERWVKYLEENQRFFTIIRTDDLLAKIQELKTITT